jgi:hypothetical protein
MTSFYPTLQVPPPGVEPLFWPINSAQQAYLASDAEIALFGGQSGGGKLMDMNELIPTPNGFVRNGDLQTGDSIFGEDGKVYKVLKAHEPQVAESYKVTFDDNTYTYVHAGHLWHTFTHADRLAMYMRTDAFRARRKERRPAKTVSASP